MQPKAPSNLSISDLGAMDQDLLRDICRHQGIQRLVVYRVTNDQATLFSDTAQSGEGALPASLSCSSFYYTAKSRIVLASGWQPLHEKVLKEHKMLRGWKAYLPVQDLWTSRMLFLIQKDGRRTGIQGGLDGFLEALGRRFHFWMAGDELRHFIDDTTSHEHTHAFSNMLSQILSHELRNPVTNLISLSQTHEMLAQETNPEQVEFAVEVGRFAQQIWNVIQKIELLTDVDAKTTIPQEKPQIIDIRELVQRTIAEEARQHSESTSKLFLAITENTIQVNGIPSLLQLSIREIIKNAYDFSNGTPIKISAFQSGTSFIFDVEEDGSPIPPGQDEMLFLRYFQGPRISNQKGALRRGLGLGLFLARFVSTMHAGQLLFVRGAGKKGLFRMILPIYETETRDKAS